MSEPVYVVVLDPDADRHAKDEIVEMARALTSAVWHARGSGWEAVGLGDGIQRFPIEQLQREPAIREIVPVGASYHLASREVFPAGTSITMPARDRMADDVTIGGGTNVTMIAGPRRFDVASAAQNARSVAAAGGDFFYGGDFVRYATVEDAARVTDELAATRAATDEAGVRLCVEIDDVKELVAAVDLVDMFVIDSRNMQNFALLREVGQTEPPIILKRGAGATAEEFILAAEYVLSGGNGRVILCEPSFEVGDAWKPPFEVNLVALLKRGTHLPVMADLSRLPGSPSLIERVAASAVAAGADGLLLQVGNEDTDPADDVANLERTTARARGIAQVLQGASVGV